MIDASLAFGVAMVLAAVGPEHLPLVKYPILGVPLAALGAGLLGSAASYLKRTGQSVEAIPLRLLGILMDAFIGSWIAMIIFHAKPLAEYGVTSMPIEALAGLTASLVQFIRTNAASYFDRAFQAWLTVLVSWFGKKAPAPVPPPSQGDDQGGAP